MLSDSLISIAKRIDMLSSSSPPPPPPPTHPWLATTAIRTVINETVARCPERTALGIKRDGAWVTWTYRQITKLLNGSLGDCKSLPWAHFWAPSLDATLTYCCWHQAILGEHHDSGEGLSQPWSRATPFSLHPWLQLAWMVAHHLQHHHSWMDGCWRPQNISSPQQLWLSHCSLVGGRLGLKRSLSSLPTSGSYRTLRGWLREVSQLAFTRLTAQKRYLKPVYNIF